MNHEDHSTNRGDASPIAPELEARIVAWVLGEASAFEASELERLCREQPELATFRAQIEEAHGLVAAATAHEGEAWRLSPDRRAQLLQTLRGSSAAASKNTRRERRFERQWTLAAAALVTVGIFVATTLWFRTGGFYSPAESDIAEFRKRPEVVEAEKKKREAESAQERRRLAPARPNPTTSPPPAATSEPASSALREVAIDGYTDAPDVGPTDISALPSAPRTESDQRSREFKADGHAGGLASEELERQLRELRAGRTGDMGRFEGRDSVAQPTIERLNGQLTELRGAPDTADEDSGGKLAEGYEDFLELHPDEVTTYQVKSGETLSAIARAHNVSVWTLQRLNDLPEPRNLRAGQTLRIPMEKSQTESLVPPAATDGEASTTDEPVSTFSLHVSDASYRLARAALARGEPPDPARIRPEEFYNAFDYGDPAPTAAELVACRIEQSAHPVLQQRNLVRIAVRVPATGRGAGQPLRLTVLLDTSGSMEREDRVATVRRAMEALASLLGPNDRVTLIGFARQPRLVLEQLPGDQAAQLVDAIARTPSEGGTNLELALDLAGQLARRGFDDAAQNRIVLLTDGAANLGNADPAQLAARIVALRQQGIAFDACGVGTAGLDDSMLEALTREGDGRYYVLDSAEDADGGFARQLAGAFRPAAENVKLQVRFNPARVARYRLVGFEQHRLREEDFRDDRVDAAELAAEEAAVALYQVEVLPEGEGELGEVFVRFRAAASGAMVERSWTISHDAHARTFDRAAPSLQLAGVAALLAEKLRGGAIGDAVQLDELAPVVHGLRTHFADDARVRDLATMFEQLRRLGGR